MSPSARASTPLPRARLPCPTGQSHPIAMRACGPVLRYMYMNMYADRDRVRYSSTGLRRLYRAFSNTVTESVAAGFLKPYGSYTDLSPYVTRYIVLS